MSIAEQLFVAEQRIVALEEENIRLKDQVKILEIQRHMTTTDPSETLSPGVTVEPEREPAPPPPPAEKLRTKFLKELLAVVMTKGMTEESGRDVLVICMEYGLDVGARVLDAMDKAANSFERIAEAHELIHLTMRDASERERSGVR